AGEQRLYEASGRWEELVAIGTKERQFPVAILEERGLHERCEICSVIDVQMRQQNHINSGHCRSALTEAQSGAARAEYLKCHACGTAANKRGVWRVCARR